MSRSPLPLRGTRILSLALNLPGPSALMQMRSLGASCTKLESPAGDPMLIYSPQAYAQMHQGVRVLQADLKTASGQKKLATLLARHDILLTSFRPAALKRLGLDWNSLRKAYPLLSLIEIVGDTQAPDVPGHDLTYLAEQGLITGEQLPPTLYADMAGSMQAVQAALQCALIKLKQPTVQGTHIRVGLAQAAQTLALPRHWALTTPSGAVGGAHALYQVYVCKNGRVAIAALEPHFAKNFCQIAGIKDSSSSALKSNAAAQAVRQFFFRKTRAELDHLSQIHDLPLLTLPAAAPI